MISLDALYNFIESLIDAAAPQTPLYGAIAFRNLRGSVDETRKIVRCECWQGRRAKTTDPECQEVEVKFIVEFYVTPDPPEPTASELQQLDAARDLSFEMMNVFFEALTDGDGPTLNKAVDVAYGDEWENGEASFGTLLRGATYFYGNIN
jgi:hypothetical protein